MSAILQPYMAAPPERREYTVAASTEGRIAGWNHSFQLRKDHPIGHKSLGWHWKYGDAKGVSASEMSACAI